MFKLKNSLIALFGLLVLVAAMAFVTARNTVGQKAAAQPSTIPPPLNVNVVNTPLPVTGTISVGNLGDSPLPVRDVDNPARQPVFFHDQLEVPTGKRLVIEYISAELRTTTTCANLQVKLFEDRSELHYFYPAFVGSNSYGLSQQTRIYVDGGKVAGLGLASSGCGSISSLFGVSGYLVDIP